MRRSITKPTNLAGRIPRRGRFTAVGIGSVARVFCIRRLAPAEPAVRLFLGHASLSRLAQRHVLVVVTFLARAPGAVAAARGVCRASHGDGYLRDDASVAARRGFR